MTEGLLEVVDLPSIKANPVVLLPPSMGVFQELAACQFYVTWFHFWMRLVAVSSERANSGWGLTQDEG